MATNRNSTDQQDTDDLRRSFMLALSDSLKTGEKVAAGTLEVVRKYLADQDATHRWQQEQAALVAGGSTVDPKAAARSTSGATAPLIGAGITLDDLPFRVSKRKGVEYPPPVKPASETDDTAKATSWDVLGSQPFMPPDH